MSADLAYLADALQQAAAFGSVLDLKPAAPGAAPGAGAPRWRVPAKLIREVLLSPSLRPDPRGLQLRGALVHGVLDLELVELPCRLTVTGSSFSHPLTLAGARIPALNLTGTRLPRLDLARARIDGAAIFDDLTATGGVTAIGAQIDGQLGLQRATLTNDNGHALNLNSARIAGNALLDDLTATGKVSAVGATISGALGLQRATLTNDNGHALTLNSARIAGSAFLTGLTAAGEVNASGAQISGALGLQQATLTNENGFALDLSGAQVSSALLSGLTATGEVNASGAHITGQLDLQQATLTNEKGLALTGRAITVGRLLLVGLTARGGLDLSRAEIDELVVDDEPSASGLPAPLIASGWQVQDLRGVIRDDRTTTRRWLDTAPAFVAQPWHELAQVYDRNGRPADATYLRLHAARRAPQTTRWWSKPPRVAYDLLVGYGYRPMRAGAWLITALLLAVGITGTHKASFEPANLTQACQAAQAARVSSPTATPAARGSTAPLCPTDPATAAGRLAVPTGSTGCQDLVGYPCLRPGLYALDTVLPPTVTTGQGTSWRPTTTWIAYTLTFLKAFGWLLTALLLAGVTGLLRKT